MRKGLSTSEAGKLGGIESAKTAAIKKQNRIENWDTNPKLCKFCKIPLLYEKRRNDFCSQNCGAKFHNEIRMGFTLSENKTSICLFCANEFKVNGTGEHKYCSRDCMFQFHWKETKEELINSGIDNSSNNQIGKKYLIELHKGKCQLCNLSEWKNQPIPLVLDHINGDPYNNLLSNLRVICNNCDALEPTFKGRNKGNGRFKRAERYKYEKEYLEGINFKH